MLLYRLTSGDYTVRVIVWTDTGQTFCFASHNDFFVFAILRFPGLAVVSLKFMARSPQS
uniref:Uncharacterized protein n=1 Tax=Arundo donax TaxID=35708 RepID=A0A0A9AU64_ARUDO